MTGRTPILLVGAALLFGAVPLRAFEATLLDAPDCSAVFSSEADRLAYGRPLEASVRVVTPEGTEAELPDIRTRLTGFATVEEFAEAAEEADGRVAKTWRFRFAPEAEGPWKLRPFVIRVRDRQTGAEKAFATQPMRFPEPEPLPAAAGEPEGEPKPVWIAPGWQTMLIWTVPALTGVILILLLLPLLRRGARALRERALPPEERARLELDRLLGQGLIAQGAFNRFYTELTGVVRRYFERSHNLRATRQTTPEFLAGLAADPGFDEERRAVLSAFLGAADRIKFAGVEGSAAEAEGATATARTAIARDAEVRRTQAKTTEKA